MTKRFIILERPKTTTVRVAFWADVPVARQPFYANAAKTSVYKDATQVEIDALRSGTVVEMVDTINYPAGQTNAQVVQSLKDRWTAYQAEINGLNDWAFYGTYWPGDGSAVVAGGVA